MIVSGTGVFANEVGSGQIGLAQALELNADTVKVSSLVLSPSALFLRLLDVRTSLTTACRATVHKGSARVAIAYAGPAYAKLYDPGLRIVSTPDVSCSATASTGAKVLVLGSSRTNSHGTALMVKTLSTKLTLGRWTVAVRCGHVTAKRAVTIR